jgi:hypothetical protein
MADEIVIGKLIIDNSELNNAMASSKKAIIDLENEQKKLKKDTEGLSSANEQQLQTFIANETELKKLKAEYAANQKSVLDLTKAQTGLDAALAKQVKTEKEAIANTAALKSARQQLDGTTVEGSKAIADINTKIDANNKLIRDSGSAQEKAATISGNYRQALFSVDSALAQFGVNGEQARNVVKGFGEGIVGAATGVSNYTSKASEAARATLGFKTAQQAAIESQVVGATVTEAQAVANVELAASQETAAVATNVSTLSLRGFTLALAATGIGIVVIAVAALISYLSKLDPVLDAIEQITSGVAAAFSSLGKAIANLDFSNLIGGMEDAYSAAVALKEAQQELADLQRSQEVANAKASQQYDELILKSKNRTLTEKERIAFINQAQKIEEQNFKQRASLAQAELDNAIEAARIKGELSAKEIANLRANTLAYGNYLLNTGKITEEQLEAIKKAELGKIEIQAESTKRLEKSQNAEDKLADDAAAKAKERAEKRAAAEDKAQQARLKNAQNEIDILKAQSAQQNLSTEQRIANAEKIFVLENKLAEQSLKGSDLQKQQIANRQELSSTILSLVDEQIQKESDAQKAAFEKRKELTQEQFNSEVQSATDLALAQTLLLDKRLLSEKAFADEVVKINALKNESLTIAQTNFDEAEKVRKATELENTRMLEEVQNEIRLQDIADRHASETEIKQALLAESYAQELIQLQQNLDAKKISNEVYLASLTLANKKYNSETTKNDKILAAQKRANNVSMAQDSISALQNVFGESKALAVAGALVNTYQGIAAGVSLGWPMAIPAVLFAAASGFAAVKNILKTDKSSTSIDSSAASTAKQATTTGAGAFVNTAQTETIARASDTPVQNNTVVTPPVLILETLQEKQEQHAIKIQSN